MQKGFGLIGFSITVVCIFLLLSIVIIQLQKRAPDPSNTETIFDSVTDAEAARDMLNQRSSEINNEL